MRKRQRPDLLRVLAIKFPDRFDHYDENVSIRRTRDQWKQKIRAHRFEPKASLSLPGLLILSTAIEAYGVENVRQAVASDPTRFKVYREANTKPSPNKTQDRVVGFEAGSEKDVHLSDVKKEFGTVQHLFQAVRNSSSRSTMDPLPMRPPRTFQALLTLVIKGMPHSQALFRVSGPRRAIYIERE